MKTIVGIFVCLLLSCSVVFGQRVRTELVPVPTMKIKEQVLGNIWKQKTKERTITFIDKCFPIGPGKEWIAYIEFHNFLITLNRKYKTQGTPIYRSHDGRYIYPPNNRF